MGNEDEPAVTKSSYTPGSKGHFVTAHELSDWWRACECGGRPPVLEQGDRWFVDPPLMWEATGDSIHTRTLHVLPPSLWLHKN